MMWWGPVQDGLTANDIDHVQLATRLRVPKSGRYSVGTSGLGEFRLVVDGEVVFDETIGLPAGADIVEAIMKPPQQLAVVELEAGPRCARRAHISTDKLWGRTGWCRGHHADCPAQRRAGL